MNKTPDISIIIPTYNQGPTLGETVASCMVQGNANVEVIVVDDGSTDGSMEAFQTRDPRVRIFRQEHRGACAARNLGLAEARGRFIKFLDSDDRLAPNVLANQVQVLTTSGADVVYGDFELFGNLQDTRVGAKPYRITGRVNDPIDALLGDWWCANFCYLYRREAIKDLRWSEDLECLQDFDFILRFAVRGKHFIYKPGIIGFYRMHEGQITSSSAYRYAVNRCKILDRTLEELKQRGAFTEKRQLLIAHGYWTTARAFYRIDPDQFKEAVSKVNQLNGHFWPRFWAPWQVRVLTGLLGIERAEKLLAMRRSIRKSLEGAKHT
jgi:glycosyltransferase involved in cell wall biosynthesis